ncbi:hypothetical protein HMI55_002992 [Coelomomyces lativittatus]|nr:hypothetical protein HMI55_002992 [Coelomomyces lativittatus]
MSESRDRQTNQEYLTYRETTERANDLLMDAFVSGTTEVPNAVLLGHPEIFKHHRSLQVNSRKRTADSTHQVSNLGNRLCLLQEYLQYDVTMTSSECENVTSAPCGYINLVVNGVPIRALWDSGAEVNLMRASKAKEISVNVTEGATILRGFDGSSSITTGTARSVHVDVGGIQGLLFFIVVENVNEDIILGRPFEVAFQTTSAVLGDGTYTGTAQNYDGTKRVTLAVLKGPTGHNDLSRPNTNLNRYPTGTGGLYQAPGQDNPKAEDSPPKLQPSVLSTPMKKENNNEKKVGPIEKNPLKVELLKKLERRYGVKKGKGSLGKLVCNMISEMEDEEMLQEVDEFLINPDSCYSSFEHLIQLEIKRTEEVYLEVKTLNTICKKVADKIRPQNVPLPEDAELLREQDSEPEKVWDRLTPENISKIKFGEMLSPKERSAYLEVMSRYQSVLGFDPEHLGRLNSCIETPLKLRTVDHTP